MTRHIGLRELALFAAALPLARSAQRVRGEPLPVVVDQMARASRRSGVEAERAIRAAGRACSRYARWFGGLDSCLTRSLVAGGLLASDHEVVLHVGFRPGTEEVRVDGHAWLVVDGERLDLTVPGQAVEPHESVLELIFGGCDS